MPLVPAAVRCSELHPWRAPCSLRTALLGAPCPSSLPSDFPARAQPQLSLFLGARPPASLLFYAAVPCVWAWRSFVRDSLGQPSADVLPCRAPYPWRVFLPACVELGLCSSLCSAFCVHLPRLLSARIPARGAFPLAKIVLARCRRLVRVPLLLQLWRFVVAVPCPLRALFFVRACSSSLFQPSAQFSLLPCHGRRVPARSSRPASPCCGLSSSLRMLSSLFPCLPRARILSACHSVSSSRIIIASIANSLATVILTASARQTCNSIYATLPYHCRVRRTSFFSARSRRTPNPGY